jgi:hypothetical protein
MAGNIGIKLRAGIVKCRVIYKTRRAPVLLTAEVDLNLLLVGIHMHAVRSVYHSSMTLARLVVNG